MRRRYDVMKQIKNPVTTYFKVNIDLSLRKEQRVKRKNPNFDQRDSVRPIDMFTIESYDTSDPKELKVVKELK